MNVTLFVLRYTSRVCALFLLAALLTQGGQAQSQGVEKVLTFIGVNALDVEDLSDAVYRTGVDFRKPSALDSLRRVLYRLYAAEGFFQMRVDSMKVDSLETSQTQVRLYVDEGNPFRVGKVMLSGLSDSAAAALLKEMDTRSGSIFSEIELNEDMVRMLDVCSRRGRPFATITIQSIVPMEEDRLDVILSVDEGPLFTIDEITVEGNTVTDADVIIRETRVRPGEPFDGSKVADIRRRVERLNFFRAVDEPRLYERAGRGGLLLRVTEGSTNTVDGLIGYQPGVRAGDPGQITGLVNLSFRNLFGTGRRLDARWERASQSVTEWELRYIEPWLFGWPVNAQGGFYQRQQDSTYVRRNFDAKLTVMWNENISVAMSVFTISSIPTRREAGFVFDRNFSIGGGLELLIDTRDNIYQSTSGFQLRNAYYYSSKSISPPDGADARSTRMQRLEADVAVFQRLVGGLTLAPAVHGRELRGGEFDPGDYFRLGGARSLRGYREEQFTGNRVLWFNGELRYGFGRRSFAFLFYDIGYIERDGIADHDVDFFSTWKRGYGVGARLETGLGVLSVSFALGEGDSFTNGKIHVGLVNDF